MKRNTELSAADRAMTYLPHPAPWPMLVQTIKNNFLEFRIKISDAMILNYKLKLIRNSDSKSVKLLHFDEFSISKY